MVTECRVKYRRCVYIYNQKEKKEKHQQRSLRYIDTNDVSVGRAFGRGTQVC